MMTSTRARHLTFNYRRHESQGTLPAIRLQPRLRASTVKTLTGSETVLLRERRLNQLEDPEPVTWRTREGDRPELVYLEPRNDGSFQSVDFRLGLPRAVKTKVIRNGRITWETDSNTVDENALREMAGLPPLEKVTASGLPRQIRWKPYHETLCADGLIRPTGSTGLREALPAAEAERQRQLRKNGFTSRT